LTDLDAASLRAVEEERRKIVPWLRANAKAYGDASDLVGSGLSAVWSGIATLIEARAHENSSGSRGQRGPT
jgi:hypothetical protein